MKDNSVLVIDYEVGNHQSVVNALNFLGYNFLISNRRDEIARAGSYILPGVGAFGEAMKNLRKLGIIGPLSEQVLKRKKPILGICLGMQILADSSLEDGFHRGLGWIEGEVVRIDSAEGLRVPRVGWSDLAVLRKEPLFERTEKNSTFYFDHSYHFRCKEARVSSRCNYGGTVVASVQKDNIFGVQFHPEKSQNNGLKLFRSFFDYVERLKPGRKEDA